MIFYIITLIANILIHLEQPSVEWSRHVIDNGLSGADGVRVADVNQDGLPDISTGWEEEGLTKIYLHPGYDQVNSKWPEVVVGLAPSVEDAVFADIDSDQATDVISSTEGDTRKMLIHWAPVGPFTKGSNWQTTAIPVSEGITKWMFSVPFDLDGFNGIDIIIGSRDPNGVIGWLRSPKNPRQVKDWSWHPISDATWIMSLILLDVNQDGKMDIVVSDRKPGATNGIRWLENPGTAGLLDSSWQNHFIGARGMEVMFMDMADLDQDGLTDAIACERTEQHIYFFRKTNALGLQWKSHKIPIPDHTGMAKAVKVADVNLDGQPDIVYSSNTMGDESKSGVYWLSYTDSPMDHDWNWHPISGTEGYKFDRLELLDLDGDGDLDVLTCEENYGTESKGLGVIWYENPLY